MTVLTFTLPSGLLLLGTLALFRVFDIVKPWPVDVLERRIPGGWGVVLDDLAAGLMAGGCMTLLLMAVTTP
jgi:phosphatidylglycerophosphatase A